MTVAETDRQLVHVCIDCLLKMANPGDLMTLNAVDQKNVGLNTQLLQQLYYLFAALDTFYEFKL